MIHREQSADVVVLRMDRGKANALDAEFLANIRDAVAAERKAPPRGLVLTADGKIFSAGFDLPALAEADREQVGRLIDALHDALLEIFTFPRPVVAAVNGHAIAGGALLTLACDLRIMSMGDFRWGLTEAQLGLPVPAFAVELARYALERRVLEKILYGGMVYPAFKAREMGILDELVETEDLVSTATAAIEAWTPSPVAFGDIKTRLHAPTVAAMATSRAADEDFVDIWFGDEARTKVRKAVADLQNRGK